MLQDLIVNVQTGLSAVRNALSFAPPWAVSFIVLVSAVIVALLIHAAILMLLHRLLRTRRPYLRSVIDATRNPTRLGLLLVAFAIALPTTPLDPETKSALERCLGLATICLLGWIALAAAHIAANLYLMSFRIDVADNFMARKHVTQVRVLLRAFDTVIVLVTVGFALMTFEAVRQYGVSLFASAGIAGVVFGLAAQPVLSNLIAGVQLAVTQPIRLEDAVTVQNEYGWIEEINATYVVIRLWDLRRLIVPLNYFIQQAFYNWSRQQTPPLGSVVLYLDYATPVDIVRAKAIELVDKTKRDNAKVTNVQVTNTSPQAIEVRILVNSDSTSTTANVCADLREQIIAFLRQEHPEALPRARSENVEPAVRLKSGAVSSATTASAETVPPPVR
ncbi:MAG TPA: mechanosensitive ion channel family protein [Bradyrhizobium sp.]|jgi:small-conductance mechanosensitive channel